MGAIFNWLVGGHAGLTVATYAVTALFAFLGAATCAFAINPKVRLPTYAEDEVDLGVLRVFLIGTISGVAVGYAPPIPFLVGLVSPILLPVLLKKTLPAIFATVQPILVSFIQTSITTKKGESKE